MAVLSLGSNIGSLTAQRQLANASSKMSKTFETLSSGLRINRAGDDAAGLSVAAGLSTDAKVYSRGVLNVNDGISYLNIAEGATTAFKNCLMRMRELATQSSNGTFSNGQRQAMDKEVQSLVQEYNRIVSTTEFNGVAVFGSSNTQLSVQAGYSVLTAALDGASSSVSSTAGDGTFQAKQDFGTGNNPRFIATADFNGDGKQDLVTANFFGNTVSVLLGNGNGTFQANQDFAFLPGSRPTAIGIADLNGDGKQDLVTANFSSNKVSSLLGNGDGTFQAEQDFATANGPSDVTIIDLNGDAKLDLVVPDSGGTTVSVLLGNGNGTFQAKQDFTTGTTPNSVALNDLNGDGKLDLAVANYSSNTVSVLLGNGNGTFQPKQDFGTGNNPTPAKIADFNSDGKWDLAVVNQGSNTVSILLGNGNGTFQAKQDFATGNSPSSMVIADFNGDGKQDVVVTNASSNTASILLGNGDGTLQAKQDFATGTNPNSVAVGDFNGDGTRDLVTANATPNTVSVLLGNTSPGATTMTSTSIAPLSGISVATLPAALSAQGAIDGFLQTVNTFTGIIGAAMSRFEGAATRLQSSADNFKAAESRIVDADIGEPSSSLVKNRILQQASAAVLAQANQQPALAIQLLRA